MAGHQNLICEKRSVFFTCHDLPSLSQLSNTKVIQSWTFAYVQLLNNPYIKGFKVTSCQSWRSHEKVCHTAPALVKPISPDSSCTGVEPFSKFDGQQLCSPLTYRPHISIIERRKPVIKCLKISRSWQHFKGGLCPVKVTSF